MTGRARVSPTVVRPRPAYAALALLVLVYVLIAVQYARLTPPWQAPDEPAHYNYVKYVAEHGALPILRMGDFPSAYLEEIKGRGFPPEMSIEPIRYESWQPPLYYLLGAAVYRLTSGLPQAGQLLALRLLSVALGTVLLLVTYHTVLALASGRTWLALGSTAIVATVPMHVAVTAAVSNDVLAELWSALLLWQMLLCLQAPGRSLRPWLVMGVTLGLAGLTKVSSLVTLPLIAGTLVWVAWQGRDGRVRALMRGSLAVGLPALAIMLPWLVRNALVYGWSDPLVFARHGAVVVGQLRTADWLAQVGVRRALADFLQTTFHSFWGQFGWMGVPIDMRLYRGLALATGLAGLGLALRLPSLAPRWREIPLSERAGLALCAGSVLLGAASLVWYNLTFVQHQGRYLFPALVPIAVFLALGWRELTRRRWRLAAAGLLLAAALVLAGGAALCGGAVDKRSVAGLLGGSLLFALAAWLPETWARWLYALPYPLLVLLDLACLYAFILPALT